MRIALAKSFLRLKNKFPNLIPGIGWSLKDSLNQGLRIEIYPDGQVWYFKGTEPSEYYDHKGKIDFYEWNKQRQGQKAIRLHQ